MRLVNVRELVRNAGVVLSQVEKGRSVVLTRNGRPVAVVNPATDRELLKTLLREAGQDLRRGGLNRTKMDRLLTEVRSELLGKNRR